MPSLPLNIPQLFLEKTGKTPHEWQIQTIAADLGGSHLVVVAPTGSGKTLPLVASVLFRDDGLTLILSALNVIANQIAELLEEYGDSVLTLHGKVLTAEMKKKALLPSCRCIILSVEMLGGADFDVLLKHPEFHKRLRYIRVDEAHCVLLWKTFRPDYARMEFLRHQFPNVQWYFTSATLSQEQIKYLKAKFGLQKDNTKVIRLSNDRPNVQLIAKEMSFPANSYEDLLVFLGPKPSEKPDGPVIVYFNSKKDCQEAATFFRATLKAINPALETKANWFHSNNSQEYAESVIRRLNTGEIWYLFATEILGMGADLTGVKLGGSWGYPPSMQSALQRAGRVGRNSSEPTTFIFFIPKSKKSDVGPQLKTEASGLSALDPILVKEEPAEPPLTILNLPSSLNSSIHTLESTESSLPPPLLTPHGTTSQGTASDGPKRKRVKTEPKKTPLTTSTNGNLKVKFDDASGVSEQKIDEDVLKLFNSKTCLRQDFSTYFSNGDSDSFVCSCVQCQNSASDPTFGALCCSVCDVSLLKIFGNTVRIIHPQKKNKSQVGKQNVVENGHPAILEIEAWARKKAREKFGWCYGGYALIVDQETIRRMVMLAKKGVLNTIQDVEHETDWYYAKELGEDILEILRHQFSKMEIPAESQVPSGSKPKKKLQLISQGQVVAEGARARRCGHCKQFGHYKPTCPDLIRLRTEGKGGEETTKKATEGKEND